MTRPRLPVQLFRTVSRYWSGGHERTRGHEPTGGHAVAGRGELSHTPPAGPDIGMGTRQAGPGEQADPRRTVDRGDEGTRGWGREGG